MSKLKQRKNWLSKRAKKTLSELNKVFFIRTSYICFVEFMNFYKKK